LASTFFEDVYEVAMLIPKGRVTSYGAIAKYLGVKSGARMVGWAMNEAHKLPHVPAHRVVNRQGLLTGKMHFPSPDTMENLLASEGVKVQNDKVINFSEIFWDPMLELS
jgi:methylated-DNA-protein-cysteine methyltransferase-like protein